jgi:hypothetical protein
MPFFRHVAITTGTRKAHVFCVKACVQLILQQPVVLLHLNAIKELYGCLQYSEPVSCIGARIGQRQLQTRNLNYGNEKQNNRRCKTSTGTHRSTNYL